MLGVHAHDEDERLKKVPFLALKKHQLKLPPYDDEDRDHERAVLPQPPRTPWGREAGRGTGDAWGDRFLKASGGGAHLEHELRRVLSLRRRVGHDHRRAARPRPSMALIALFTSQPRPPVRPPKSLTHNPLNATASSFAPKPETTTEVGAGK